jgi:hypothetical protein
VPSDVIATVMVLQALEGLSDRQAVRRLETDIAWKAAAGLALTDEAFHPTVLVLWRNKLRASEAPQRIFDAVRAVIAGSGVIAGKTRRALDSTVLDDAVARQDTITMLVTQIRRVRRLIPELASVWVREHNLEGGRPPCDWEDPTDIERLVSELVDDANELVWAVEDLGLALSAEQADAVALLALVAGQDVEPGDGPGRWRIAQRTAPDRVVSTNDPESRHTHKTDHAYRDGFKAHVATEPETGLVTDCDLTPGNTADGETAPGLIDDEPDGTVVLGDSAYGTGEFRDHLERNAKTAVIKPPPLRPAVPGGFDLDDFEIDTEAATMTCPAGIPVTLTAKGRATFGAHCKGCPLRRALHDGGRRPQGRASSPPPPPRRGSGPGQDRGVRRRLSALSAHGRANPGLAHPRDEPQAPLPRRRAQPAVVVAPLRGGQPAAPDHPRPEPGEGPWLGHRLKIGEAPHLRAHGPPRRLGHKLGDAAPGVVPAHSSWNAPFPRPCRRRERYWPLLSGLLERVARRLDRGGWRPRVLRYTPLVQGVAGDAAGFAPTGRSARDQDRLCPEDLDDAATTATGAASRIP